MPMTIKTYIEANLAAGRFPSIGIDGVEGLYWLCDRDWKPFKGGKHYTSKDAALNDRSKTLDRVSKQFWAKQAKE